MEFGATGAVQFSSAGRASCASFYACRPLHRLQTIAARAVMPLEWALTVADCDKRASLGAAADERAITRAVRRGRAGNRDGCWVRITVCGTMPQRAYRLSILANDVRQRSGLNWTTRMRTKTLTASRLCLLAFACAVELVFGCQPIPACVTSVQVGASTYGPSTLSNRALTF